MKQQILKFLKEINQNFTFEYSKEQVYYLQLLNQDKIEDIIYDLCLRIEEAFPTVRQDLEDEEGLLLEDLIIEAFPEFE